MNTYATTTDNGATWVAKRHQPATYANGVSPPSDADMATIGMYPEVYPDQGACSAPCCSVSDEPILIGGQATYSAIHLSDEDCATRWRSQHRVALKGQIPVFTLTDKAADFTADSRAEQWQNKYKSALLAMDTTPDADLPTFNATLADYDSSEQDYAANMVGQETRSLLIDKERKDSGGTGKYTASEVSAMQSRIAFNEGVAQGTQTGVQTPDIGAPRGDAALENESAEKALLQEVSFDWNSNPQYIPQVILPSIPEGQDPAHVFCMVYDATNVYRSWMPFEQQADGTWKTPSDIDYIGIAETVSSNWRVAVAIGGTQSEFEVTSRVFLVPPQVAESIVRFGGRT